MNNEKPANQPRVRFSPMWVVDSFVPGMFIWAAMTMTESGLSQIARHTGPAIFQMACALFLTWIAFFFLIARLRQSSST